MTMAETAVPMTAGALRALERLERPLEALTSAAVLDDAAWLARMEDTMPGRTGVFSRASADAMELHDWLMDNTATGKAA